MGVVVTPRNMEICVLLSTFLLISGEVQWVRAWLTHQWVHLNVVNYFSDTVRMGVIVTPRNMEICVLISTFLLISGEVQWVRAWITHQWVHLNVVNYFSDTVRMGVVVTPRNMEVYVLLSTFLLISGEVQWVRAWLTHQWVHFNVVNYFSDTVRWVWLSHPEIWRFAY